MKYVRVYGNTVVVALLDIVAIVLAPTFVRVVIDYLPHSFGISATAHVDAISTGVQVLIALVGAVVIRFLVQGRSLALHEFGLVDQEGAVEVYRGFVHDVGVEPQVARHVVDVNSQMGDDERRNDFRRANQPNFAAELGYHLGVNAETRKMMRDFFADADRDARRSFSTSTHVTIEDGRIEQTHDTQAEVTPLSRYVSREHDGNVVRESDLVEKEIKGKIFSKWGESQQEELKIEALPGDLFADEESLDTQTWWESEFGQDNEKDSMTVLDESGGAGLGLADDPEVSTGDIATDDETGTSDIVAELDLSGDLDYLEEFDETEISSSDESYRWPEIVEEDGEDGEDGLVFSSVFDLDEEDGLDEEDVDERTPAETFGLDIDVSDDVEGNTAGDVGQSEAATLENDEVPEIEPTWEDDEIEVFSDDDEVFVQVQNDPAIDRLIKAMGLTRRLPDAENMRHLYVFYDSDLELLATEFREASVTHVDQLGPNSRVQPLFRHAGVRRHKTPAWVIDLSGYPEREDDLSAVVWIPVGITHLGDQGDHLAWKLAAVPSGSDATFFVLRDHAPLAAARLEWILGSLYADLRIDRREKSVAYVLPSLGVTIDLVLSEDFSDVEYTIHSDEDRVSGPSRTATSDVGFLSDLGQKWLAARLDLDQVEHSDLLALVSMITKLVMQSESVTSKELLNRWAEPGSPRGKDLIAMMKTVFGDTFSGDDEGWVLSNVRLDIFWLEELLAAEPTEDLSEKLVDFFVRQFDPEILAWLHNLGAMDPRMRTNESAQLDKLVKDVLTQAVALLGDGSQGILAEHLNAINATIGG